MDNAALIAFVRLMVGRTVDRLCSERGISQSGFAAMISVDRSHLNQLINGKHNFTLDMLVKIADGLDVPLAALFVGLDELPPHKLMLSYNRSRPKGAAGEKDQGPEGRPGDGGDGTACPGATAARIAAVPPARATLAPTERRSEHARLPDRRLRP